MFPILLLAGMSAGSNTDEACFTIRLERNHDATPLENMPYYCLGLDLIWKGERKLELKEGLEITGWPEPPAAQQIDGTLNGGFHFDGQAVKLKIGNDTVQQRCLRRQSREK